jgi:hypothetical protein
MKSRATARFWKAYDRLPPTIQESADSAYLIWRDNPYYPSLQFKRVHTELPIYSVRVGRGFRALGLLEGDTIIWYWIGGHDEYVRLLR